MSPRTLDSHSSWQRMLRGMRGRCVGVVGDAMLDAFLWGDTTRISPEAPVPIVLLEKQSWCLGGAANVAANIAGLGGRPVLFGVRGRDRAGERLQQLAQARGIALGALVALGERPTTVKYRVFARNKHLLRCDRETTQAIAPAAAARVLAALRAHSGLEAVVISDYSKGCVTPALLRGVADFCRRRGIPWCVDPKQTALRYRGATVLKPNRSELQALSGLPVRTPEERRRAARRVLHAHGCRFLLVTLGAEGMVLYDAAGRERAFAGAAREVSDVTGAGDTVTAVIGLGLAASLPVASVVPLAHRAARFVVSQPGTAIATAEAMQGDLLK